MTTTLDIGLLILRVATGLTFAAHGYVKMFRGGRIAGTGRWFDSIGMRPGRVFAILAAGTEMIGGLFFALGLLTPFAAASIVAVMIVAAWTSHRTNGFFIVADGWEYNFILSVIAVSVAATGPGRYSVDSVFGFADGTIAMAGVALILGAAAGIAQLSAFYRPRRE